MFYCDGCDGCDGQTGPMSMGVLPPPMHALLETPSQGFSCCAPRTSGVLVREGNGDEQSVGGRLSGRVGELCVKLHSWCLDVRQPQPESTTTVVLIVLRRLPILEVMKHGRWSCILFCFVVHMCLCVCGVLSFVSPLLLRVLSSCDRKRVFLPRNSINKNQRGVHIYTVV